MQGRPDRRQSVHCSLQFTEPRPKFRTGGQPGGTRFGACTSRPVSTPGKRMQMEEGHVTQATPLFVAADLQDNLLMAASDLERLQGLLSGACDSLCQSFSAAAANLSGASGGESLPAAKVELAMAHLGETVVALQFQDLASQLIAHTQQRLRHCTDRLAHDTFTDDSEDEVVITPVPLRPNPVTQDEMDAGSIDLF